MTKSLTASDEMTVNDDTIADLAQETDQPLPVVKAIYEEIFARLKASARVHDYVVLFARRQTRDVLVRARAAAPQPGPRYGRR